MNMAFFGTGGEGPAQHCLLDLAGLLGRRDSIAELFTAFATRLAQDVSLDYASLVLFEEDRRFVRVAGSYPRDRSFAATGTSWPERDMPISRARPDPTGRQFLTAGEEPLSTRELSAAGFQLVWCAPLLDGTEVFGLLTVARRAADRFAEPETDLFRRAAGLLGATVRRELELEGARRTAARTEILNELALLLNAGEPVRTLFDRILAVLEEAIAFDYVSLMTPGPQPGELVMAGSRPALGLAGGSVVTPSAIGLSASVAAGAEVIQYRADRTPGHWATELRERGVTRLVSAVLQHKSELLGLFTVGRFRNARFTPADEAFLATVGIILSQAIARQARRNALGAGVVRAEQEAARNRLLNDLAVLLHAGEPIEAFFDRLRSVLAPVLPFDFMSLLVRDSEDEPFLIQAGVEPRELVVEGPRISFERMQFDPDRPVRTLVRVFDPDRLDIYRAPAMAALGLRSAAACILREGGVVLGVLSVARRDPSGFEAEEVAFLEILVTILAQAIGQRRRLAQARAETGRRELLTELSILLNNGEPVEALFGRLPHLVRSAVDFDYAGIALAMPAAEPALKTLDWWREEPAPSESRGLGQGLFSVDGFAAYPAGVFQFEPQSDDPSGAPFAAMGLRRSAITVLRHQGEVLGAFHLSRFEDRRFRTDEVAFLDIVGKLLAQALASQRRVERAQAEAEARRVVGEAAAIAAREPDRRRLVSHLTAALASWIPDPVVAFGFVDGDRISYDDETMGRVDAVMGQFAREAVAAGQLVGDEPPTIDPPAPRIVRLAEIGAHAWSITSARSAGQVVGLLIVASRTPGYRFSERKLESFREIAGTAGPAIANALAGARARRDAAEQRALADVAAVAAREPDPTALAAALEPALEPLIPRPTVEFCFLDGDELLYHSPRHGRAGINPGPYAKQALSQGQIVVEGVPADLQPTAAAWFREDAVARHVLTAARSAGATVGLLVTGTRESSHRFSERDLELLGRIAQVVGPAMANGLAAQRSTAEAAEQRIVAAVAAAAARESDPGALVHAILQPLRELFPRPTLAYGYVDGADVVYPVPGGGVDRLPISRHHRLADVVGQVVAPELADDVPTGDRFRELGVHAVAVTVARSGGVTVGFLLTGSRQAGYRFGERESRIFRLIAQIIGPAMESARAAQRAVEEAREQRLLAEIAAAAAREPTETGLLRGIIPPFREAIPKVVLGFGVPEGDTLVHVSRDGPRRVALLPADHAAIEEGQYVLVGLPDSMPADHPARVWKIASAAITATYSAGQATGLLYVGTSDPEFSFGERDLQLIQRAAQVVGPAMASVRRAAQVAQQSALYQLMFESLSEAVVLLDHNLQTVFANEPGKRLMDLVDPERRLRTVDEHARRMPRDAREAFRRAVTERVPCKGRVEIHASTGSAWYDYELVPLDDPGLSLLAVASDVTEAVLRHDEEEARREQMEQASRLAALGELIGGVAHELNNPLTAILGFAEVLAKSEAREGISEELAIIRKEALRARNVVRDLLVIARPGQLEPTRVDLHDVAAHIGRLRQNSWVAGGITATVEIQDPCEVWGNETQLTQVLLNLVTNAEHALEDTARRELIICARRAGGSVVLEVSDTGRGMDEATAARVFEPFFTTKQGLGTGLGLSLSYSIVRSHNGTIEVESRPGRGATFRLVLPAPDGPAVLSLPVQPRMAPAGVRVLAIDDEPSLRKVIQRLVSSMGHQCTVADTVDSALALLLTEPFDVVICDYRLASETADVIVERLADVAPELVSRVVIATGATTDAGVLELVARYGLQLVAKPYGFDEIANLINSAGREAAAS